MSKLFNLVLLSLSAVLLMGIFANCKEKRVELPGNYLEAWMVCYSDFKQISNMSDEQKKLDNYRVKFDKNDMEYSIEFIPKLLTDAEMKKIHRMTLGRNIKYRVSIDGYKVIKREFYK